ncbi:tRNA (adenosine(37)-N6)-threonylcarbamoyltransferase complex ATPase subunit type 1 TsaE [Silanimonas sp.]|jgi:tRNA threonylcarbamoyladenosine biosynthesis protein TsaE|uniref:tRNA (adenosine(37)-N6)-threonylcarbamoyltransferase complex ATPase subunit type 1 TsaE n=1 Tax=Silanimonas sp. TaxID=1929290 RepID=UPI0022CAFF7C|nr:tRNA (adenosine(37)-N6)-threonylcarbamoyltransferase complex ATPase subunit type 1 TsaE [Silanimonas sp.]MCZ8113901.1 tRNA (adenosine(37)-N6)-threonylcarbamoyltransferase complex ATPase subunit type 1 TsaE [Silanimonas sp.]
MSSPFLADAEATAALGARLAATRPDRAVVHLQGDLGAGKSTLARALLRALGVTGTIRSPTYTLIERYALPGGEAAHLDLYRLGDAAELDFLGLDELQDAAALWLVEWPERGGTALPAPDLVIRLVLDAAGRRAVLEPTSDVGREWIRRLDGASGRAVTGIFAPT